MSGMVFVTLLCCRLLSFKLTIMLGFVSMSVL